MVRESARRAMEFVPSACFFDADDLGSRRRNATPGFRIVAQTSVRSAPGEPMNARVLSAGILAALTAFASPSIAQSEDPLELASRLFERAGLGAQLQSLPEQFAEGV